MSARKLIPLMLLAAGAAHGDGSATTLFDSSPYSRDGGHQDNSVYESFALSARSEGTGWLQDVKVVARGWGRLTFGTAFDDHQGAGDLDSLFVEGRLAKRHLLLRLGRQLATGGAVRATQIDGLVADAVITSGIGVQGWSGVPVQPRFSQAQGDFLAGGRAFWRRAFDSEVGVSYVYALRRGYLARSDLGVDGSWTPLRAVTVSGLAQWSLADSRLQEAKLQGLWQIDPKVQVVADLGRTAPDLFIDRSSIFAVFSEEFRNEAGAEVVYRPLQPLSLEADFHWLNVVGGAGYRTGARATYRTPWGASYGCELRLLDEPDNGYTLARIFGIRKPRQDITITLDLDGSWLHREINGRTGSFVGTLTGGWAFLPNWEAMLATSFGTTPYFETRTQVVARLAYRFGIPAAIPGGFK